MRLTISDRLVARTATEGSAGPFAVSVWTDTDIPWVLVTPTTLRYRVDDPDTGREIVAWTTVTPASTATITVTGSQNTLTDYPDRQRRQLVIQADAGLSTMCVETREYWVRGLVGVT